MNDAAMRRWCARIQFPDKGTLLFGTTHCDARAPMHEVEAALRRDIDDHLPAGWRLIDIIPGAIFFHAEHKERVRV